MHAAGCRQGDAYLAAQQGDPAHGQQAVGRTGKLGAVDGFQRIEVDVRLEKAVEQRDARRPGGFGLADEVGQG